MKKLTLGVLMTFTVGCSGFESYNTKVNQDLLNVSEGQKTNSVEKPYCEVDYADYELETKILAFEITDKGNISFGFNILKGFFKALGLSIKTERGEMLAAMHMSEALRPMESVADVTGRGSSSKTEFNMDLDLIQLGLDVGYFYQTPLSKLTEKTLKDTLKNLRDETNAAETDWHTKIVRMYPFDQQMIVPVGSVAGVRVGDKFKIFNVDYAWEGDPCVSTLLFERRRTSMPSAIAEVTQLEKNASLLTIVQKDTDDVIEEGARVEIQELPLGKKEKSRSLARSVRLRSFQSQKLVVPGAQDVDLTVYISNQTQALLNQYGYYPRK